MTTIPGFRVWCQVHRQDLFENDHYPEWFQSGDLSGFCCAYSEDNDECAQSWRISPIGRPEVNILDLLKPAPEKTKEDREGQAAFERAALMVEQLIPEPANRGNLAGREALRWMRATEEAECLRDVGVAELAEQIYDGGIKMPDDIRIGQEILEKDPDEWELEVKDFFRDQKQTP